ncbi:MAG: iron ABC transporter permease [candidate division WOR-3 bacterium]
MNKSLVLVLLLVLGVVLELVVGVPDLSKEEILLLRGYRIVLGIYAGGVLAFCGSVLQGLFGNPLVEPFTLGSASGAALGSAMGMVFFQYASPAFAFAGALIIGFLVFTIARVEGGLLRDRLILSGVIMSFLCSALVMLIMIAGRKELYEVLYLLMGYLGIVITPQNRLMLIVLLAISAFLVFYLYRYYREFDILTTGVESAQALGLDIQRFSMEVFVVATLLVSFVVSLVGAIGFVGLVIPHISRMLFGPRHIRNLGGSLVLGATFVLFSDALTRMFTVYELPTGVITSLLGVPFFIYLYRRKGT